MSCKQKNWIANGNTNRIKIENVEIQNTEIQQYLNNEFLNSVFQLSLTVFYGLGKGSNKQNENLRWYLPWGGGGLEGVSSATYLFWKMIFFKNHLESFPDCENVFCT